MFLNLNDWFYNTIYQVQLSDMKLLLLLAYLLQIRIISIIYLTIKYETGNKFSLIKFVQVKKIYIFSRSERYRIICNVTNKSNLLNQLIYAYGLGYSYYYSTGPIDRKGNALKSWPKTVFFFMNLGLLLNDRH